ncbi:MAG TPA: hypothetical protein VL443_24530 [Cyclobacteriaceae bacterium]|jgi:hypothetical protein|nr:hypothetical protein [Cyclobacteriaceae bacterium]
MKIYKVKIKGITPYMQHRMDDQKLEQWEKQRGPIHERPELVKEDLVRAEYHCYRNSDEQCFIPSEQIRGALIAAGSYVKAKVGGRSKSMKQIVAAMFMVSPDQILLPDFDSIDKRSAVNRNVKARVIVVRPKWSEWSAEFTLSIDEDSITIQTIEQIIEYAGKYVGIGSFRPSNNGMFGRFELTTIKLL